MEECSEDIAYYGSFYQYLAILPIILLQILLLGQTVFHEMIMEASSSQDFKPVHKTLRNLYIALQLLGLYWTVTEFIRFVNAAAFEEINKGFFCGMLAISPWLCVCYYYALYLYILLYRVYHSFEASSLALKKSAFMTTTVVIVVIYVFVTPLIIFFLDADRAPCLRSWYPLDMPSTVFTFCSLPTNAPTNNGILATLATFTAILNGIFARILYGKLQRLLVTHNDTEIRFHFKSLIVKITVLSVFGVVSTLVCWCLYMGLPESAGHFFVFVDVFLNCLVNGFMFKYNEPNYKKACKCCIVVCFVNCNKDKSKENEVQMKRDLDSYFKSSRTELKVPKNVTIEKTETTKAPSRVPQSIEFDSTNGNGVLTPEPAVTLRLEMNRFPSDLVPDTENMTPSAPE